MTQTTEASTSYIDQAINANTKRTGRFRSQVLTARRNMAWRMVQAEAERNAR